MTDQGATVMPLHIEELTSEVTVVSGDLPLSREQIDRLVAIVLKRLEQKQRENRRSRAASAIKSGISELD